MKSKDLPIGAHVVYDTYESTVGPHNFAEAFVFDTRPKGTKQSFWGSRTGNNDTIAIAYTDSWWKKVHGESRWHFKWVRPATIHYAWDEYQEIQNRTREYEAIQAQARRDLESQRADILDSIPESVLKAFEIGDWKKRELIKGNRVYVDISLELVQNVVHAARLTDPETMTVRIQTEIDSALKLLG